MTFQMKLIKKGWKVRKSFMIFMACLVLFITIFSLKLQMATLEIAVDGLVIQNHILQEQVQKSKCFKCHAKERPPLEWRI